MKWIKRIDFLGSTYHRTARVVNVCGGAHGSLERHLPHVKATMHWRRPLARLTRPA